MQQLCSHTGQRMLTDLPGCRCAAVLELAKEKALRERIAKKLEKATEEKSTARSKVKGQEEQLEIIKQQLMTKEAENSALEGKIVDLEDEIDGKDSGIAALEAENQDYGSRFEEVARQSNQKYQTIDNLLGDNIYLRAQVKMRDKQILGLELENINLKDEYGVRAEDVL